MWIRLKKIKPNYPKISTSFCKIACTVYCYRKMFQCNSSAEKVLIISLRTEQDDKSSRLEEDGSLKKVSFY